MTTPERTPKRFRKLKVAGMILVPMIVFGVVHSAISEDAGATINMDTTTTTMEATTTTTEATTTTTKAPATTTTTVATDPRFGTCGEAIDAGYGPYTLDDPEFYWYIDGDDDGTVCES